MDRAVDRTLLLEHLVSALCGRDLVGRHTLQSEDDVDATKHEDTAINLDVAIGRGGELTAARSDLARLQRATKGAEQSPASRCNHVVERCRVGIGHVAFDPVVTCNRPVCPKAHRFGLGRQRRETERTLDAGQRDLGSIDDFTHRSLLDAERDDTSVLLPLA